MEEEHCGGPLKKTQRGAATKGCTVASPPKGRRPEGLELNFKHLTRGRESAETRTSRAGPGIKSKFTARRPGQEVNRNRVRRKNLDFILRSPGAAGSREGGQGQAAPGACAWVPVCLSPLAPQGGRGDCSPSFLRICVAATHGVPRWGTSLQPTHLWVLCPTPKIPPGCGAPPTNRPASCPPPSPTTVWALGGGWQNSGPNVGSAQRKG